MLLNIFPRNARKISSAAEAIFLKFVVMSLMAKLTLAMTLTIIKKCYSVSLSWIDENNDRVA